MRYISALLISLFFLARVQGQNILPTPPTTSPTPQKFQLPRQLTLDKAEEILLQNNLAVVAARYGVDVARAQRLIASLRPNPTLTLGAEQFDVAHPLLHVFSTNPNAAANKLYTFRFDLVFERGNKRKLRTEVAELQLQAAEAQVLDVIREQMFQLRQAFYAAVLARENMRVAEENLHTIDNMEQLIKLRVEVGDVAEWELIKFQANKVQFQRDLVSAQLSYQQSVLDLLNILGVRLSSGSDQSPSSLANFPIEVVGDLNIEPLPLPLSLEELRQAIEDRPDVIAAQRNLEAAYRSLDLAYAMRHRDVDVAWEYQRNGGENTLGIVVSVPLFVFNKYQGVINQALSQLEQAKAQLARIKLQAITDLEKAYRTYELSRQMLNVYTAQTLARAEESYRIAAISYREGAASLLELLDAQRTYNQTRMAANQARFDYIMSLYQLELATGKSLVRQIAGKPDQGFEVDVAAGRANCPRWRQSCADGTEPGVKPNPPGACRDGSTPVQVCEYLIDLNRDGSYIYEERETPSWCYEHTKADKACAGGTCTTARENAVDDWRVTVPWCWDQTNRLEGRTVIRDITQPANFGQTDRTAERDHCFGNVRKPK